MFLAGLRLLAEAPEFVPLNPVDLSRESPIDRIKKRNLFNPSRGLPGPVEIAKLRQSIKLPVMVGSSISKQQRIALLLWPGASNAANAEEGTTLEGIQILKVEPERVWVQVLATSEKAWLDLEQQKSAPESGGSDLQKLITGMALNVPPKEVKGPGTTR